MFIIDARKTAFCRILGITHHARIQSGGGKEAGPPLKNHKHIGFVELRISYFANFAPCEELVPKRHFWKMLNLRMVSFDNFWGLTSVLKFHIFLILTVKNWYVFVSSAMGWFGFLRCEELVLNFHKCEESVSVLHNSKV